MNRIVIVDDNPANRYLVEHAFTRAGWKVTAAADGSEALARARAEPPDLIITDVLMPQMDGFALCRQWRADAVLKHIPLIFYTATYTDAEDEKLALDLGGDRFVCGPEDPKRLVEIAAEVMTKKQTGGAPVTIGAPADEAVVLRQYNEVLIRKLEKKLLDLEALNRDLEMEHAKRKESDAANRDQLSDLEAIYAATPVGLCQVDLNLRFVRVNDRLAAINGVAATEHIGRTFLDVIPDVAPRIEPLYRKVIETGTPILDLEVRGITPAHPSAERIWLVSYYPLADDKGEPRGVIAAVLDVTERVEAREALAESERFSRSTLDALPVNICVIDERGIILFVNAAWNRFAQDNGVAPQSVGAGCNYLEVCLHAAGPSAEAAAEFAAKLEEVLRGERNEFEMDYACHSPDKKRWFTGRATRFAGEGPVRAVILHINITEKQVLQQALEERERLLSESQRVAHIGSWGWDLSGPIQWSDETYRIYGVSRDAFTPTVESLVNLVHPDDRRAMQHWLEACLAGQSPAELEFRAVHPSGSVRYLSGRGDLIYDAQNRPTYMAGTVQDITDRQKIEQALRDNETRLRVLSSRLIDAQEFERQSIARELHDEIGQELTALKLSLSQMARSARGGKQNRELEAAVAVTDTVLDQVRSLSLQLRPPQLELMGLEAALDWHTRSLADKSGLDLRFEAHLEAEGRTPEFDITCFRIVQEALTNVIRHANAGVVTVKIEQTSSDVRILVQDDGKGFDVEESTRGALLGSSVGLLGMQERANLHDGTLRIESGPGRGTTIHARIPLKRREILTPKTKGANA